MALASATKVAIRAALACSSAAKEVLGLLGQLSGGIGSVVLTVGAEAADAIPLTIQVKDEWGNNVTAVHELTLSLLTSAAGVDFTANTYTVAATTGKLATVVTNKLFRVLTDATGLAVVTVTNAGVVTCFAGVGLPNGQRTISATITHA